MISIVIACNINCYRLEIVMKQVTVSSKFQVVIPREVREPMDFQPGTRVQVLRYENRIELIPSKGAQIFAAGLSRGLIRRWIARISSDLKLPLAAGVVLATVRTHLGVIWTQDAHLKGLGGVRYTGKI